jgi:hypothetical protein
MKGHIRERSPGHWAIVLDVHDAATGKRKRKWHSFHGTKRQAQIESARLISELQGGGYLEPSKVTFVSGSGISNLACHPGRMNDIRNS